MAEQQTTTDFQLKSVKIFPLGGGDPLEIKSLIYNISYSESVLSPYVGATMSIADSGGLINSLPIKGGETIQISIKTSSSEEPVDYIFSVWTIVNRYTKNQEQAYTLGLISPEGLNNEFYRIQRKLEDRMDSIVIDILRNEIKTTKNINSEQTLYAASLIPTNRRPFDIIHSIALKSVPASAQIFTTVGDNKSGMKTLNGTAGYFFWENKRGYNFFGIDSMVSRDPIKGSGGKVLYDVPPWGPYVERVVNRGDGADERFTIISANFRSELDLMTSMRKGKYSSLMVFFNHSTGQHEEFLYSVSNAYQSMKHLTSQNKPNLLPVQGSADKTVADYPTKIMSFMLDHETWYNEPDIASREEQDGSENPSRFCDEHKNFAAQSVMRYELLKNQTATVVIPGNSEICAGDKIDIKLTNKTPNENQKQEPYDPESSGIYLIEEVTHTYEATVSANGRFTTTLRLMRDSFGDIETKHGQ
jgi:hypothetical protein